MAKRTETALLFWKMKHDQLLQLIWAYQEQLQGLDYDNMLEYLLLAHVRDMYLKLVVIENNMNEGGKCTLRMTSSEAIAFHEYWRVTLVDERSYANVLINGMIEKINKAFANIKIMQHE
jgi:hypothetical protein